MVGSHSWISHVDQGALDWAAKKVGQFRSIESICFLDVGCGMMGMVDIALERFWACGVDADIRLFNRPDLKNKDRLYISDFRETNVVFPIHFDIVWSVEVGEHIPEDCVRNYVQTIADAMAPRRRYHPYYHASILIFSAAPVTGNPKHCNEHPISWWAERFRHYDLILQDEMTRELRAASTMERNFVRDNGFVFIKEGYDAP